MVWVAISSYYEGSIIITHVNVTARDYIPILTDKVHQMVQRLFLGGGPFILKIFPFHTYILSRRGLVNMHIKFHDFPGLLHSPDINIKDTLWSILEYKFQLILYWNFI